MPSSSKNFDITDAALRALVRKVIRDCPKKREQIAQEMSARLGVPVSLHTLNCFTAGRKRSHRFPVAFVSAFCGVVGDSSLQRFAAGEKLIGLIELGEAVLRILGERECDAICGKGSRKKAR